MQGKLVKTLLENEDLKNGTYDFIWDGNNEKGSKLPAGVYFGILQAGNENDTHKLILMD